MKALLALALATASPLAFAASFGVEGLFALVIQLVVAGLIFWLLYWFIGQVGLPEPFNKVAIVIISLVVVIFLIDILLGLSGGNPPSHWRWR